MFVHVFPSLPQVMFYDGLTCFAGNLMLDAVGVWLLVWLISWYPEGGLQ